MFSLFYECTQNKHITILHCFPWLVYEKAKDKLFLASGAQSNFIWDSSDYWIDKLRCNAVNAAKVGASNEKVLLWHKKYKGTDDMERKHDVIMMFFQPR